MVNATQVGMLFVFMLLVSLAYAIWLLTRKRASALLPMLASVLTTFIVFALLAQYQSPSYLQLLYIELGVALTSSIMAELYLAKPKVFIVSVLLLMMWLLFYASSGFPGFAPIGVFGFSTAYGLVYRTAHYKQTKPRKNEKAREIRRDVVQVALGAILIALLVLAKLSLTVPVAFVLMILGYIVNNMVGDKSLGKLLKPIAFKLERAESMHGAGALYTAAGTAMILGLVGNISAVMFGVIILFFADPAATVIGIGFKSPKLQYNSGKSALGTLAFYTVAALLGYIVLGIGAFILAAPLAFIESTDTPLDDNLMLAAAIVTLALFAGL